MTEDAVLMIAAAAVVVSLIVAATVFHLRRQRLLASASRERERTIQLLTERFGSAPEFLAFAASPEGAFLFATLDAPSAFARRLISLVATALVLLAIGAGFWINALSLSGETDINFIRRAADERWWGTLCLACGLGLGAAAAASSWLARRWGLIGR